MHCHTLFFFSTRWTGHYAPGDRVWSLASLPRSSAAVGLWVWRSELPACRRLHSGTWSLAAWMRFAWTRQVDWLCPIHHHPGRPLDWSIQAWPIDDHGGTYGLVSTRRAISTAASTSPGMAVPFHTQGLHSGAAQGPLLASCAECGGGWFVYSDFLINRNIINARVVYLFYKFTSHSRFWCTPLLKAH